MRKRKVSPDGLTVNAIAGTHAVLLGFDLAAKARKGCLGFAIRREDRTEGETYWLEGMKVFEATDPGLGAGARVSTRKHPVQSFQWSDFSAKPGHDYVYRVVPLGGTPGALVEGAPVDVAVTTEVEAGTPHGLYFNRGAVSSQEYARRFGNRPPDEAGPAAYAWLSRGLLEGFEAFVARAEGKGFGLRGAFYEFQWKEALAALKAADERGADVEIVHDAIAGATGPRKKNQAAIAKAGLGGCCHGRTAGKLMHDKFLVLTRGGEPVAVWTGSTNLTENGIFGHANCGHVVEDAVVAARYLDCWTRLRDDAALADQRDWTEAETPVPPEGGACQVVFSPRHGTAALDWIAAQAATAERALFMTFAFGMAPEFQAVYERDDLNRSGPVLRCALMEKEGNGAGLAKGKVDVARIRKRPNVVIAVGSNVQLNALDRWLAERRSLSAQDNVHWVHLKSMLVDPLGADPLVVTGSANFSKASTDTNDENMLVVRGDRRVADVYLTEFMRLFASHAFRETAGRSGGKPKDWHPSFLVAGPAWMDRYFRPGQDQLRRVYFSGG